MLRQLGAVAATWASLAVRVVADCKNIAPLGFPQAAPGVRFKVLANDLYNPRQLIFDVESNILLVEQGRGIRRIVLDDGDGIDVGIENSSVIIENPDLTHSLALCNDGKSLLASSDTEVICYNYSATEGWMQMPTAVITGMAPGGDHRTRTLLVPPQNPSRLIVAHGSISNVDEAAYNVSSGRSQIRIFHHDEFLTLGSASFTEVGEPYARGLRNVVGLGEDPSTGWIWSVENSMDNFQRFGEDVHGDNPGDELNFHGIPDETSSEYGKHFGYPDCVAIWDPSSVNLYNDAQTGKQMSGSHSKEVVSDDECQVLFVPPKLTFGAHQSPLDITFLNDGSAALVAFHGSWNRDVPTGFRLSKIPFSNGMPVADSASKNAEAPLLWNRYMDKCPDDCFRPVSIAVDKKGRVFMTSDSTGELYVLEV
ncbi:hypothetical protein S7711_03538 [Stachybotrys chartarum IBT 7711]|uniref:Pyrroloquinoline quinone-dependent pyranose dehydrogenase beta-propeller domain-containing protein n=1 Tax=Stachybotrys chartarum (strain CBS 109288 / IBT 7711) TaxID=1280523 RepID=A0A084B1P3_STACB|nr:hypothetical protein S7711_03538 [Stachybotrys chartarum IBT 7711]